MTQAERELLLVIAARMRHAAPNNEALKRAYEGVLDQGQVVTPRAKYVSLESGGPEIRTRLLCCSGCGDEIIRGVRLGQYADPTWVCCSTCIAEAAQILREVA